MITKKIVQETLNELPESFSVDDFIDHLIFIDKVDKGLQDSKERKTIPFEEAKEKMKKWST